MATIRRGKNNIPGAFDINGDGEIDATEEQIWRADSAAGGNNNSMPDREDIVHGMIEAGHADTRYGDQNGDGQIDHYDRNMWLRQNGITREEQVAENRQYERFSQFGLEGDWENYDGHASKNFSYKKRPDAAGFFGGILSGVAHAVTGQYGSLGQDAYQIGDSVATKRRHKDDAVGGPDRFGDGSDRGDYTYNMQHGYWMNSHAYNNKQSGSENGSGPTAEELQAHYERMDPNARLLDDSAASHVSADPRDVAAQQRALDGLQVTADGKYSAEEISGQRLLQQQAGQWERSQRDAIMQQAGERGVGGSNVELMNLLGAQQGSANRSAQGTLELQRVAAARALQAQQSLMDGTGKMRQQGFDERAYNAEAIDDLHKYNTTYQRGIDAINSGMSNAEEDSRINATQQVYDNSLSNRNMTLQEWETHQQQKNADRKRKDEKTEADIANATGFITDLGDSFKTSDTEDTPTERNDVRSVYEAKPSPVTYSSYEDVNPEEENAAGLGRWR